MLTYEYRYDDSINYNDMASKCDKQISTHSITNAFILQSLSSCTYRLGVQCHFVQFLVFRLTITSLLCLISTSALISATYFSYFRLFSVLFSVKSSQVTFIYIALLTIQIVSKHLTVSNFSLNFSSDFPPPAVWQQVYHLH